MRKEGKDGREGGKKREKEGKSNPLGHLYSRAKCVPNFCKNIRYHHYQQNEQTTPHAYTKSVVVIRLLFLISLSFIPSVLYLGTFLNHEKDKIYIYLHINHKDRINSLLEKLNQVRFNFLRHIWGWTKREGRRLRIIVRI